MCYRFFLFSPKKVRKEWGRYSREIEQITTNEKISNFLLKTVDKKHFAWYTNEAVTNNSKQTLARWSSG